MVYIDTVYQRVLAIANKEQRGYITPQEFNLYANQAQMDIFEQYFYDLNQFMRGPGNDTRYADVVDILQEKIDHFEKYRQNIDMSPDPAGQGYLPVYYRMGELYYKHRGGYVEIEEANQNEIHHLQNSPLTAPSLSRPMYVRLSNAGDGQANRERQIQIYPTTIENNVVCNYIARPATVAWGYVVNATNGRALYSADRTTNFELHEADETELVIKILELAGITVKDAQLYQAAATEEAQKTQQEKQ